MDRRLQRYYNRELEYLREVGGEFAREFPKIAGRLGLDPAGKDVCPDPYVERLLEGFAFLTARVQLKLDAEFPRFTQGLFEAVFPHYLGPTPSMAVVQFQPDPAEGGLAEGFTIPRGTQLRSLLGKDEQTACQYVTGQDATLFPIEIIDAKYHLRDLGSLSPPANTPARAALRLRLRCMGDKGFDKLKIDSLVVFIRGSGEIPAKVHEHLLSHGRAIAVRAASGNTALHKWHSGGVVRRIGFEPNHALLPHGPRSFHGYRLLQEYFAFPQRFMFVEFTGVGAALRNTKDREADLVVLLGAENRDLEGRLDKDLFALHCAPAINLFPRRADRIHVSRSEWEFHVVPDRTKPLDYEVYEVRAATGYGSSADVVQKFRPFFAATDDDALKGVSGAYFSVRRQSRLLTTKEQRGGRRSSYPGSDVFISLVDSANAPFQADIRQLACETLCTNRDLPLQMTLGRGRTDFTMESSAPVLATRCIAGPTAPRPSRAEGELAWRIISHLSLNYLSLADSDQRQGAAGLRDLLRLYAEEHDEQATRQIDGVRSIAVKPISRQVSGGGPIAFARGLEVALTLDDNAFEGTGSFILGAVLDCFFAKYVSLNSFTETVVRSAQRGEVIRWPAMVGRRHMI
ncbi:MAG: type VI secretion system baseplate subunit TssF [Phycisphaerae bacterium]|nr:type VI secretion system baseplate subunit TssF [Phycisphaerae bacterium]